MTFSPPVPCWAPEPHSEVQDLAELCDVLVVMPGMPLFGFWTGWWNHGEGGSGSRAPGGTELRRRAQQGGGR
ncbi:hypothetical protein [Streptomyces liangshanensis]|uniref:Uncharacterized protein n=1 Tax=Streptomyces liangshanensis TaxID=2717324 RepID=A0A6G9GTF7_9ACTN|nr:hypothetical protein [Streptomyces liangshanensis]QIQ01349.1 hypothetical protein HA039_02710 [Streptomyces liangshanensis]